MGVNMLISRKGFLAVSVPEFQKIEADLRGGLAVVAQRIKLASVTLIMDYELDGLNLKAGKTKILLRGDSALKPWAKQKLELGDLSFVLCPESDVVGVQIDTE